MKALKIAKNAAIPAFLELTANLAKVQVLAGFR
jgi:hypothetical protein